MIVNKKRVYVKRNLNIDIYKIPLMTKIESLEDFKKAGVLKAQPFKYYCKRCGKLHVITSFNDDKHLVKTRYSRMLCRNCGRKAFNLEKYGVEEFAGLPEIQEKIKKTLMKNYGVDHPSKSKEIMDRIKKKFLKKYGTEWMAASKIVQDKIKATNQKRLGVDYPFQKDSVQVKVKDSFMKNIGYTNPACSPKWQEENRKRNIEKYGGPSPFSSDKVQEIAHERIYKKYGVSNVMFNKEFVKKLADDREKRIGVRSTLLLPENIEKTKKTMMKNYGVEKYAQSIEYRKRRRYSLFYKDNEHFDSSWELAVWIYCKDHNIPIEREPFSLEYCDENGNKCFYFPDFKINGELVEIKGDCFLDYDGKIFNKAKQKCMDDNGVKLVSSGDDLLIKSMQYVKNAYPVNYIKCFSPYSLYNYNPIQYQPYQTIEPYKYYFIQNIFAMHTFKSYKQNFGKGVTPFDLVDDGSKYVAHPDGEIGVTPFDIFGNKK